MTIVRELIKPLQCGMDIPQGLSLSCSLVLSSRERVVHFQGPYFSQKNTQEFELDILDFYCSSLR